MADDIHEVYAIRYGHHSRRSPANFIDGDPHDILQPLDFFVWAIVGSSGAFIVDTGFDEAMGKKRQRGMIKPVRDGLAALGIAPEVKNRPNSMSGSCLLSPDTDQIADLTIGRRRAKSRLMQCSKDRLY